MAQTIINSFENIIISSKRQPILIETDAGSEFVNKILTNILKTKNSKRYSRKTSLGAVIPEI